MQKEAAAQIQQEKPDFVTRINEYMLKMVVNIITPSGGTGSAFIVNQTDRVFLVTNKHMVGKYSLIDSFSIYPEITVHFYPLTADSSIIVKIELTDKLGQILPSVKPHPEHDVDIVVVEITELLKAHKNIPLNSLGTGILVPLSDLRTTAQVDLGTQIFTIGYPAGFKFEKTNYPIAKAGYIVSPITGDLKIEAGSQNATGKYVSKTLETKFFLVDGQIIGGNSGGPVFSSKEIYFDSNTREMKFKVDNWVIGIVSSGWPGTGLTIIYPCDYILDLITQFLTP